MIMLFTHIYDHGNINKSLTDNQSDKYIFNQYSHHTLQGTQSNKYNKTPFNWLV